MSTRTWVWRAMAAYAVLFLGQIAAAQSGVARVGTFEKDGQHYFAMTLLPQIASDPDQQNDVVILIDTSASQAGAYRAQQLAALEGMLATLAPTDRVQLMAVDMKAVPMSAGFVAPQGPQMQAALAKLAGRTPLGATDLDAGLRSAAAAFNAGDRTRTIIYVGDAVSKANVLTDASLQQLVSDLTAAKISVSSYVTGQEKNLPLMAALANHTGGLVVGDPASADGANMNGRLLGASVHASVVWPTSTEVQGGVTATYPAEVPPLRSDRDTVVIGTLGELGQVSAQVAGTLNGKPVNLNWSIPAERPSEDFSFLPKLVQLAAIDQGLTLPTAGSAWLREAGYVTLHSAEQLARLGHEALAAGNFAGAEKVAAAALARDPGNPQALALREAARKGASAGRPQPSNEADLRLASATAPTEVVAPGAVLPPPPASAPGGLLAEVLAEEEPGFLSRVEADRAVFASRMQAEVDNALAAARTLMSTNPDQAEQDLKLTLEAIERTVDLDPALRGQLRQRVENAIRAARQLRLEVEQRIAVAEEQRAIALEQERINEALAIQTQRIKQIVDRFTSLIAERRYDIAEQVIPEVERLAPGTSIEASLFNGGRIMRAVADNERIWRVKEDNFLKALFTVEISLVPFPDEPPIVYLPPDQWEDLTLRRQKYKAVDLGKQGGPEERIFQELNRTTELDVVEMPLKDVVQYLNDRHGIPIVLMAKKLEEASVSQDTPVTKSLRGVTLRSALRLVLKDLELTYVVRDEVLQITTPEDAESQLITKVYPVGDLVVPPGVGNMLGGGLGGGMMGGGMNGMMNGGGMGGGMGGMGGGMGGMGGGMGGMGGGMFAVEDELSLGTKKPAAAKSAPAAPAKAAARPAEAGRQQVAKPAPQRLVVTANEGESIASAWDRYFAAEESRLAGLTEPQSAAAELQASIRETVRQLMDEKQYGEVATLIEAALRHDQMQPWMYEGLALALRADSLAKIEKGEKIDAAQTEALERALLSAVDFARDENQLVMIAAYMAQAGLEKRALSVYQQISKTNPARPEPLLQGLALAQRLNDVQAIQWACVGILSQAWSGEQRQLAERAYRIGRATYEHLLSEGRQSEAEAFDAAVRKAQQRDVVVVVTWTGDADLDVSVEEPSGTLVSQRQPRSIGGGAHLGDVSAADGKSTTSGFSETYVCPEGFSGEYRVQIRNVWGRPTSDKVTVDVYTHYGADNQSRVRDQIPIAEKSAVVKFQLAEGRRKDPLPEVQVAEVAKVQNALNRTILAQQLAAANNSSGSAAQGFAASVATGNDMGFVPGFFLRGAVGYRPVITLIPSGAEFSTNAVISADRRYVRVSPSPSFMQITEVNTFNFVTGQGNTQGQGAGGVGGGGGGFGGGGIGF